MSNYSYLCKECAKKRGLEVPENQNPNQNNSNSFNNINNIDMNNMSKQLESLFKDLSSNYLNCKELIDIAINNYSTEEVLDNIDDKDIVEYLNSIKNIK